MLLGEKSNMLDNTKFLKIHWQFYALIYEVLVNIICKSMFAKPGKDRVHWFMF